MGKEEEVRNRKERKENASSHARQWDLGDRFSVRGLLPHIHTQISRRARLVSREIGVVEWHLEQQMMERMFIICGYVLIYLLPT